MCPKILQKAFTLIEMMLTIAVMATFATLGIATYQQKMQNAKIDQAVQDMGVLLQAGVAYRIADTQDQWPSITTLIEKEYIKKYSNPWISCTKNTVNNCYETGQSARADNYVVTLFLPPSLPNAATIAALVANRLPNGVSASIGGGRTYYISAEIPLPPQVLAKKQVEVLKIQTVEFTDQNKRDGLKVAYPAEKSTCTVEKPFKRFVSLVSFFAFDATILVKYSVNHVKISDTPNNLDIMKATSSNILIDVYTLSPFAEGTSYKGSVLVIDACVPAKTTVNINQPKTLESTTASDNAGNYRY